MFLKADPIVDPVRNMPRLRSLVARLRARERASSGMAARSSPIPLNGHQFSRRARVDGGRAGGPAFTLGGTMIKRIKFVSIPVADQKRALDFYTDKLGFTIITDQPFDEKQRWIELRRRRRRASCSSRWMATRHESAR